VVSQTIFDPDFCTMVVVTFWNPLTSEDTGTSL
jgi:hypothetical protein